MTGWISVSHPYALAADSSYMNGEPWATLHSHCKWELGEGKCSRWDFLPACKPSSLLGS